MSNNHLVGLPTSIQKLNGLSQLYLDRNELTELPAEIGDLKELWQLSVSNNHLVGLPTSIQKLNWLRELYVDRNKLTELPAEIGHLGQLRKLGVRGNPLTVGAIRCALKLEKKGVHSDIAGEYK